ncbi:hypothetical protein E2C01_003616 [Portunus trituberculatus]|uniref:Uncharacterized protein n=1 Tax=Portunus trituberculatus TaxID=210409 RepID=A0A5B7CN82_PORTR|nr:hypothetical protein [Portunus trituberculatus]
MTKKTNSEGKTLEEANNINKSLMVLAHYLPFRDMHRCLVRPPQEGWTHTLQRL